MFIALAPAYVHFSPRKMCHILIFWKMQKNIYNPFLEGGGLIFSTKLVKRIQNGVPHDQSQKWQKIESIFILATIAITKLKFLSDIILVCHLLIIYLSHYAILIISFAKSVA